MNFNKQNLLTIAACILAAYIIDRTVVSYTPEDSTILVIRLRMVVIISVLLYAVLKVIQMIERAIKNRSAGKS